jgi:hypothetical protein
MVLLLALGGCGVAAWQDPPRGLGTICDGDAAHSGIGHHGDVEARPRPECRPSPAAP